MNLVQAYRRTTIELSIMQKNRFPSSYSGFVSRVICSSSFMKSDMSSDTIKVMAKGSKMNLRWPPLLVRDCMKGSPYVRLELYLMVEN
jgi:hypothetical protein